MAGMAESEQRTTEFVGVSSEPGRDIEDSGLYEFFTNTGVHIYLHDTDFLGIVWQPKATMCLYFSYDEDWTPPEAQDTPVVELVFSDVQVLQWETDLGALSGDEPFLGEVSAFDWDGNEGFDLSAYNFALSFSARRVQVRLALSAPDVLAPAPESP